MIIKRHTAGGEKFKPRKVGDAPAIGNVQMVSGESPPIRKRRSARTTPKRKYSKRFLAFALLGSFAVISIIIVAVVRQIRQKVLIPESVNHTEKTINLDQVFEEVEDSDLPELKSDEAIKIVTQALANRDPALIQDFFLLGKGDIPVEAMKELIRIHDAEGEINRTEWLGVKFPNERIARQVVVHTAIDEIEQTRRAQFAPGSDGKWRIDLQAYLRKCDPPIEKVASAESGTFVVRVFVAEETSYRGIYSDKSQWRAYSLTSPDITDALYAYAKRGSSQDKALRSIVITDENLQHVTLSIIKQEDSDPRQFEVSRVISANWIVGEKDFDESF